MLLGLSQMIIVGQKNNIFSGGKGPLYSTRSCLCISVFLSLIILYKEVISKQNVRVLLNNLC